MLNEKFNPLVTLVTIKASAKEILNLNNKVGVGEPYIRAYIYHVSQYQ